MFINLLLPVQCTPSVDLSTAWLEILQGGGCPNREGWVEDNWLAHFTIFPNREESSITDSHISTGNTSVLPISAPGIWNKVQLAFQLKIKISLLSRLLCFRNQTRSDLLKQMSLTNNQRIEKSGWTWGRGGQWNRKWRTWKHLVKHRQGWDCDD